MRNGGNQAINSVFEARYLGEPKKPGPQADIQTRERFIRAKYIDRKFYSENAYLNVKSHADKEYLPPSEVRSKSSSRLQRLSSLPTKLSVPPIERMPASCSEKPNNNSHTFTKPQDQVTDSVHGHVDTSESLDKNKLNYRDQQSKLFNQAQLIKLASPKANFASDDPSENIKNRFLDYMSQPIKLSPNSKFVACSDSGDNAKGLLRTWSDSPSAPEASVKDTRVDVPNSLNQRFHTFRVHKDVETSLKQTKNDAPNSLNETFRNFRVSGEISPILEGSHDLNNSWLSQKPWSFWM